MSQQILLQEQRIYKETVTASAILMQAQEEQCYKTYTDGKGRFCARAVLARYFGGYDDKGNPTDKLPEATRKVQDLFYREGQLDSGIDLPDLNDNKRMTFKEIAQYLRERGY